MHTRSKERAMEAVAREIIAQIGLERVDNLGDCESIIIDGDVVLNLDSIVDALLAELEIEVEWEEIDHE